MLCRLTSHAPDDLISNLPCLTKPEHVTDIPNLIDFLFSSSPYWKLKDKGTIYIGVYNSSPFKGPIDFTIQLRKYRESELITPVLKPKMMLYDSVFKGNEASGVSMSERIVKDLASTQ